MITKLKWLKASFSRAILPAAGATVGKVLYTGTNTTGRRKQYVIDLDAKTMSNTTINAYPADPLTSPGAVVIASGLKAPANDTSLYIIGASTLPVITKVVQSAFSQEIANGASITAVNILTGVTIKNAAGVTASATTSTATLFSVVANGLSLNTGTGVVTLTDNLTAGTYTLSYRIEDKTEPSVFVTGTITVIVDVAP